MWRSLVLMIFLSGCPKKNIHKKTTKENIPKKVFWGTKQSVRKWMNLCALMVMAYTPRVALSTNWLLNWIQLLDAKKENNFINWYLRLVSFNSINWISGWLFYLNRNKWQYPFVVHTILLCVDIASACFRVKNSISLRSIQQQQQKYILRIVTNHTWSCGPIHTYIYYSANVMLAFIYIYSRIQTIGIAGLGRTGTPNTRFQRPEFFSSLEICRANKKWNKQKSESKWLLWLWIFHGLPNAHGHTNHFHFGAGWLAMFACFSILYFSCVFK